MPKTGLVCSNCGKPLYVWMDPIVVYDEEYDERFVDVVYRCKDCDVYRVARYKSEYVFCNIKDFKSLFFDYRPLNDNREFIEYTDPPPEP